MCGCNLYRNRLLWYEGVFLLLIRGCSTPWLVQNNRLNAADYLGGTTQLRSDCYKRAARRLWLTDKPTSKWMCEDMIYRESSTRRVSNLTIKILQRWMVNNPTFTANFRRLTQHMKGCKACGSFFPFPQTNICM